MQYEPHEYQKYAIDYIETHPLAAVLLDMGLGKTSITLTAIADLLFDSFEVHKVLVIAPPARSPGYLERRNPEMGPPAASAVFRSRRYRDRAQSRSPAAG